MKQTSKEFVKEFNTIIVGAGSAGLGTAIVLDQMGIEYMVLEKDEIGSSFKKWPEESCLISPSFTGNFFNMPDLNSISPETSPAFNLATEHPTGKEYAQYLEIVAEAYKLKIQTKIKVNHVTRNKGLFCLDTTEGVYKSKYVIWAAGEYQYPNKEAFEGADLCTHFSEVSSFSELEGDHRIIIGGYESGFDAAINLIHANKEAVIFDSLNYLELFNSDSSYSLSPYTRDRINEVYYDLTYHKDTKAKKVEYQDGLYVVTTSNLDRFTSPYKPINCTGFDTSITLVQDLFEHNDGYPVLNDSDESTITNNLFLVGPQVKHGNALFCFIYKYRQRFAIVAQEIAEREKVSKETITQVLELYKQQNFYLKDLSCCDNECTC